MTEMGSVTFWITQLKAGQRDAVQQLWQAYYQRLVGLSRARLQAVPRQVADEEDVALSAFHSFCRAAEAGHFPRLEDRDDLWQILVLLAGRKAVNLAREARAQKRGGGQVQNASALAAAADGPMFAELIGREPDPALAAEVAEQCERLLGLLDDELLRRIALLKLEGHSNEEIAVQIGRSVVTVERKLRLIRDRWARAPAAED